MKLAEAIADYEQWLERQAKPRSSKPYSVATIRTYVSLLNNFHYWQCQQRKEGVPKLGDFNTESVNRFLLDYMRSKHSSSSCATTVAALRSFGEFYIERAWADVNPAAKAISPEVIHEPRTPVRADELEAMIKATERLRHDWRKLMTRSLLHVFGFTGIRLGSLLGLRVQDVNFSTRTLNLAQVKGGKQQTTPFGERTEGVLRAYIGLRPACEFDTLFWWQDSEGRARPVTKRVIYGALQEIASMVDRMPHERAIDLMAGRKHWGCPHCYRHSAAVTARANGATLEQVQKMLGHKNINTTVVYTDEGAEMARNAVNAAEGVAPMPPLAHAHTAKVNQRNRVRLINRTR